MLYESLQGLSKHDLIQMKTEVLAAINQFDVTLRNEIQSAIDRSEQASDKRAQSIRLPERLSNLAKKEVQILKEARILNSLRFPAMNMRHANIIDAHEKTFRWIFDRSEGNTCPGIKLKEWLLSGNDIFWIAGKAGSGKSTFMKYVFPDTPFP